MVEKRKSTMVAESKTKPHEITPSDMKAVATKSQTATVNNRERSVQIIHAHAANTIPTQRLMEKRPKPKEKGPKPTGEEKKTQNKKTRLSLTA